MGHNRRHPDSDPGSVVYQRDLAIGLGALGVALGGGGSLVEAVEPLRRSVELREGLVAGDPGSVVYQRELAIAKRKLAEALDDQTPE